MLPRWARGYAARMGHANMDYTSTPMPKKLGVREGSRVLVVNSPDGFAEALQPAGAELASRATRNLDVIVLFATRQGEIDRRFARLARSLGPSGRLWVCWPKKSSKVKTDVTFESAQRAGLDGGLVDNKSASINDAYQGVQFVYRLRDRPR